MPIPPNLIRGLVGQGLDDRVRQTDPQEVTHCSYLGRVHAIELAVPTRLVLLDAGLCKQEVDLPLDRLVRRALALGDELGVHDICLRAEQPEDEDQAQDHLATRGLQ